MKKHVALLAVAALLCILFAASCKQDSGNEEHTDPAFLEGTWASENSAYTFTIEEDLSFECVIQSEAIYARITGKLDADASDLGPNDYLLRDLVSETMDDDTHPYNVTVAPGVAGMSDTTVVTLTPNADNTRFTFSSTNDLARTFFTSDGADFTKQP